MPQFGKEVLVLEILFHAQIATWVNRVVMEIEMK
jgi:hypothetical protein